MCGRFTLTSGEQTVMHTLGLTDIPKAYRPTYNAAPSQHILAARDSEAGRRGALLRWGLVPSWAKDPKIGHNMINARAETIDERPSFREAFEQRRCIIPADGFYEWRKIDGKSYPVRFRLRDESLFAFAGLWERWRPADGNDTNTLFTCTIVTTEANDVVAPVHARMPVVLTGDAIDRWLDRSLSGHEVKSLLKPYPSELMEGYDVSPHVNTPANNDPSCIQPI